MKAIKNILMTSAVIACTMLCLFSCTSKDMLSIAVEACAEECPMDLGGGLVMTDVTIQNGDVVYLYEMDENSYDIASIKSDPITQALMKEAMLEELNNSSDKSLHDFIKIVRKSNADIIYRYVGSESGKGFDIVINNSEL
jgi:hypothetical protein